MKQPHSYFVFNKPLDYRRGWSYNLQCTQGGVQLADPSRPGVFWSRLLDSREKENLWHRLTMDTSGLGEFSVRLTFYCGEECMVNWNDQRQELAELLRDESLDDYHRQSFSAPWQVCTFSEPRDVLLHDLKGRYLWFRMELNPQGGQSPWAGNLKLRFPRETWLDYLPELYQGEGSSFTGRFLGIFQSLYDDLDEEIRNVARRFDPEVADGAYLEWLASWLDTEDGYLWPQEKLRELVRRGMELYRIRGTRRYLVEMVKLYTGQEPWVVEHSQVAPFCTGVEQTALLRELYGDSPYTVTLILNGADLEGGEAYETKKALMRIIDNARPAWVEVELVVLTPYLFLDQHSYLGVNSALELHQEMNLNGRSAISFTRLGESNDKGERTL